MLVFGLGGLLTEWYGSLAPGATTVILRPGEVKQGLQAAVNKHPALKIFFERNRGQAQPPLALDAVASLLETLSKNLLFSFSPDNSLGNPTLEELEVNPLLLCADGRWVAADGKARLSARRAVHASRPLAKIAKLLAPKSAAVIGVSASEMNPGRIILKNLKQSEGVAYGHLWVVHAHQASIDGVPCVPSVAALPEKVDLAVVSVPAPAATEVVAALADGKAESIILIPGGFGEAGRGDLEAALRKALADAHARPDGGPVLVGGNCLGIVSKRQYNTFFLPQYKLPFHDARGDSLVAVSQSGAYLVSLTSNLDGIVFPRASISYGNQMDLTAADFLEYFADDPTVRLLVFYIEGFAPGDGERFVRAARRVTSEGRHVIVFKAGKTALGAEATRSHTASLAGDYAVAQALLENAGVLVAQSLDMFEDITKVHTMLGDRPPGGRRLAVLSNAGFECSAVLDKLYGLTSASLAAPTLARLKACLPGIAHAANPVDATPMADTPAFVEAAAAMLDDPGVDMLLVSPIPVTPALDILAPDPFGAHAENLFSKASLAQELLRLFRETKKPVVVNVDSGKALRRLRHGPPARRHPGLPQDRPGLAGARGARAALIHLLRTPSRPAEPRIPSQEAAREPGKPARRRDAQPRRDGADPPAPRNLRVPGARARQDGRRGPAHGRERAVLPREAVPAGAGGVRPLLADAARPRGTRGDGAADQGPPGRLIPALRGTFPA